MMKLLKFLLGCTVLIILSGCLFENSSVDIIPITPTIEVPEKDDEKIAREVMTQIMTTEKKMALTFNGLADPNTMILLLDELDRFDLKATFFLPGMRIAEDPEISKEILKRGHTVHNNTYNHVLVDDLTYEEAFLELELANKVFLDHLGVEPEYARSRSGDSSKAFEDAAAQLDMQVVSYSINPKDSNMQSAIEIADYINRFAKRGAIIELNTHINPEIIPAIEQIYQNASDAGYELTTLDNVISGKYSTQNNLVSNNLTVQTNMKDINPKIIDRFKTTEKELVLSFDDWANDYTISTVLDILNQHQIKANFFLIGSGVEKTPQLARLIYENGHEIASHSYNHEVVTDMEALALQRDIVKNDKILSDALQVKPLNYFRPAQGLIDDETARLISSTGVEYIILFDVASHDWNLDLTEDEVFQRVIERTQPGSIIGLHILDESHILNVLPRIIEHYQDKGYVFKTISEMIEKYDEE